MSMSLKAAEIIVRVIVLIFQVLTLIGGVVLLNHEFYPHEPERTNPAINGVGVSIVILAVIVSIYEVLMIIFALIKHVNHPARLVVDIVLNSVMAGLIILLTLGLTLLTVILYVSGIIHFAGIAAAIFFPPIGIGVMYSVLFVVSAISAGIIRLKLINEARELQSSSLAPPSGSTFMLVQQPTTVGQPGVVYPPSYDTTFGQTPAIPVTSDPAATGAKHNYGHQPGYQAGYPSDSATVGETGDQKVATESYSHKLWTKIPAQ